MRGNNVGDTSSDYMINTWQGAGGNLLAEEKIYGNGLFLGKLTYMTPVYQRENLGFSSDESGFTVRTGQHPSSDKAVIVPGTG